MTSPSKGERVAGVPLSVPGRLFDDHLETLVMRAQRVLECVEQGDHEGAATMRATCEPTSRR